MRLAMVWSEDCDEWGGESVSAPSGAAWLATNESGWSLLDRGHILAIGTA